MTIDSLLTRKPAFHGKLTSISWEGIQFPFFRLDFGWNHISSNKISVFVPTLCLLLLFAAVGLVLREWLGEDNGGAGSWLGLILFSFFEIQDVITDLNAEGEPLPVEPPREDWIGHKVNNSLPSL